MRCQYNPFLLPIESEPPETRSSLYRTATVETSTTANVKEQTGKHQQPDVVHFNRYKHGDEDKQKEPSGVSRKKSSLLNQLLLSV